LHGAGTLSIKFNTRPTRSHTFPIAPIPIMPNFKPLGSVHGTWSFRHKPALADFSAREVSRMTARVRNIAISAVGSETEFRVLQNQMSFSVSQSIGNLSYPADADTIVLQ
jgi:hypothetical protein